MTREQFEASLVEAPEAGLSGEAVFDFRAIPSAPRMNFRHKTVLEWSADGYAMEECWRAYLRDFEADWEE